MTLPSPIGSAVFTDGELTNETKWYTRIFSVVNQIIAYLAAQSGQQRVYTGRRSAAVNAKDSFASGSFVTLMSVSLPSTAAAGSYDMAVHLDVESTSLTSGTLRFILPTAATTDRTYTVAASSTGRTPMDYSGAFTWPGGAGLAQVQVQVNAGTGAVYNAPALLELKYFGP